MLKAEGLAKHYPVVGGVRALFSRGGGPVVRAVDGIDFSVARGEVLGIVGESGCGKSSLARMLVGLEPPSAGRFELDGEDGAGLLAADRRQFYRRIQMVFQDPYASINPSHDIFRVVAAPLLYQGVRDRPEVERRVRAAMTMVGLDPPDRYLGKHPHLLSGGQRQRLCIARALILEPRILIADEPVSMLDVSIKWDIIRLLKRLVAEQALSLIYITHDLATVASVCDRLAILYLGQIVEAGPARQVLRDPVHPYTRALVAAVPGARPDAGGQAPLIAGEIGSAVDRPPGCSFANRCPRRQAQCTAQAPVLAPVAGREVACLRAGEP